MNKKRKNIIKFNVNNIENKSQIFYNGENKIVEQL